MSRTPSRLDVRAAGDRWVVEVVGDLDVSRVGELRRTVNGLVVEGRVHVVIDLRGVEFLDSSGLGVLVGAHRKLRAFKGSLTLLAEEGPVTRLLGLTGLDLVLRRRSTLEDALAR